MNTFNLADHRETRAARELQDLLAALQREARPNGTWEPTTAIELLQDFLDAQGFDLVAPAVTIDEDDNLVCPACGAHNQVQEEDRAVRRNDLEIIDGKLTASLGYGTYHHVRFVCEACDITVTVDREVDDWGV